MCLLDLYNNCLHFHRETLSFFLPLQLQHESTRTPPHQPTAQLAPPRCFSPWPEAKRKLQKQRVTQDCHILQVFCSCSFSLHIVHLYRFCLLNTPSLLYSASNPIVHQASPTTIECRACDKTKGYSSTRNNTTGFNFALDKRQGDDTRCDWDW